jgi:hypothetical protein
MASPIPEGGTPAIRRQPHPPLKLAVINPIFRALMRSPAHGAVHKAFMLLHLTGRKTGKRYSLVVAPSRDRRRTVRPHGFAVASQHARRRRRPDHRPGRHASGARRPRGGAGRGGACRFAAASGSRRTAAAFSVRVRPQMSVG